MQDAPSETKARRVPWTCPAPGGCCARAGRPAWRRPGREPPGGAGHAVPKGDASGAQAPAAAYEHRATEQQRTTGGGRRTQVIAAGVCQCLVLHGLPDLPALPAGRGRVRRDTGVHLTGDIGRRPVPRPRRTGAFMPRRLVTRRPVPRRLVAGRLVMPGRLVARRLVAGRLVISGRLVAGRLMTGRLVISGRLVSRRLMARRLVAGRLMARRLMTGGLVARRLVTGWVVVAAGIGAVVAEDGIEQADDVDGVAAQVHRQMDGGLEQVAREHSGGGRGAPRGAGVGVRACRRAGQYPGRRRGDQHAVFHELVHVWSFIFRR